MAARPWLLRPQGTPLPTRLPSHHPVDPPFLACLPFLAPPDAGAACFFLGAAFLGFFADLKSSSLPSSASASLSARGCSEKRVGCWCGCWRMLGAARNGMAAVGSGLQQWAAAVGCSSGLQQWAVPQEQEAAALHLTPLAACAWWLLLPLRTWAGAWWVTPGRRCASADPAAGAGARHEQQHLLPREQQARNARNASQHSNECGHALRPVCLGPPLSPAHPPACPAHLRLLHHPGLRLLSRQQAVLGTPARRHFAARPLLLEGRVEAAQRIHLHTGDGSIQPQTAGALVSGAQPGDRVSVKPVGKPGSGAGSHQAVALMHWRLPPCFALLPIPCRRAAPAPAHPPACTHLCGRLARLPRHVKHLLLPLHSPPRCAAARLRRLGLGGSGWCGSRRLLFRRCRCGGRCLLAARADPRRLATRSRLLRQGAAAAAAAAAAGAQQVLEGGKAVATAGAPCSWQPCKAEPWASSARLAPASLPSCRRHPWGWTFSATWALQPNNKLVGA